MSGQPLRLDRAPQSIEVDRVHGGLTLRWWEMAAQADGLIRTVCEVQVPPHEVLTLLRKVVQEGSCALEDVAEAYAYGECGTCRNARLVKVPRHGREILEYCPDCRKGRDAVPFKDWPAPRAGGGDAA